MTLSKPRSCVVRGGTSIWCQKSWELRGKPPSLLDFADRDRRWCQGNLQHGRLVTARGFSWLSRLHLLLGIMSYLASPLWLLFMLLGLLLALQAHFLRPDYFPQAFALFPSWPVFDPERAVRLFVGTMGVLVAPKLCGYLLLWQDRASWRAAMGDGYALASVCVCDTMLSALIAPVMMIMQSVVVMGIVTGRDVGWKTQRRDDGSPLSAAAPAPPAQTLFGEGPASLPLWCPPPVSRVGVRGRVVGADHPYSGADRVGNSGQRGGGPAGTLVMGGAPEETAPPQVLQTRQCADPGAHRPVPASG